MVSHENEKEWGIISLDLTQDGRTARTVSVEVHRVRVIASYYHEGVLRVDHSKSGVDGVREPDGFQQSLSSVAAMMGKVNQSALDLKESHDI